MKKFYDSLTITEKMVVKKALNVYGNRETTTANMINLHTFDLFYAAHCLGKMHFNVVGSELDKAKKFQREDILVHHRIHEEILTKMKKAIGVDA